MSTEPYDTLLNFNLTLILILTLKILLKIQCNCKPHWLLLYQALWQVMHVGQCWRIHILHFPQTPSFLSTTDIGDFICGFFFSSYVGTFSGASRCFNFTPELSISKGRLFQGCSSCVKSHAQWFSRLRCDSKKVSRTSSTEASYCQI